MTHQDECPAIDDLTALLIEHGPVVMAGKVRELRSPSFTRTPRSQ